MKTTKILAVCGAVAGMTRLAGAAAITPGNLLVYRVDGNGAAPSFDAAIVHVDEYQLDGTLVQTFTMPSGASGTRLTASGSATSEGKLSVSPNGEYVALLGYDAQENTANVKAIANRTVAIIKTADGSVDLTTTGPLAGTANDNARSATVDNTGTNIWIANHSGAASSRGVFYLSLGQTTPGNQLANPNSRGVRIFGGQLYEWGDASGNYGVFEVGSGLPISGSQTLNGLPGISGSTLGTYGFFMADLDNTVPGYDTLWMARDTTGVSKYSLVGGTWTLNNTIDPGQVVHIDGYFQAGGVVLAVVEGSTHSTTRIMTLTDTSGYNANMVGSFAEVVGDPEFNAFRGVAFAIPEPGTMTLLAVAGLALAARRRLRG